MTFALRTLSRNESRVVLSLTEQGRREVERREIARMLGSNLQGADQVIRALRRKGWLERASWGRYLLIPPDQGPEALGESNLLALASRIADPYYIGYGTAATHYGLTTQTRNTICLVTPQRKRSRRLHDTEVRIVNPTSRKFFGFGPVDVLGYPVMMSDREKTTIDCIDRPDLAGGIGEAAYILATASRRLDWQKTTEYLDRMVSPSLVRQFGWLADHAKAEMPLEVRAHLLRYVDRNLSAFLGPKLPVRGAVGFNATWRLTVNVTPDELQGSHGLGRI
jgi:predicted transcriptional regulator of viral defense system